jgi:aspartate oxidase
VYSLWAEQEKKLKSVDREMVRNKIKEWTTSDNTKSDKSRLIKLLEELQAASAGIARRSQGIKNALDRSERIQRSIKKSVSIKYHYIYIDT